MIQPKFPTTKFYHPNKFHFAISFALLVTLYCYSCFESTTLEYSRNSNKTSSKKSQIVNKDITKIDIDVHVSRAEKASLPTISELENLYGPKLVIHGLDSCQAYRDTVSELDRWIGSAGLYNTGTNLMTKLLQLNCYFPHRLNETEKLLQELRDDELNCKSNFHCMNQYLWKKTIKNGIGVEVPWGKHNPASWRLHHPFYNNSILDFGSFNKLKVLPIVMIKDPVNWMSSMCRNSYGVQWRRNTICPYLVPDKNDKKSIFTGIDGVRVTIKHRNDPKHSSTSYLSLLDLWNKYYNGWINSTNTSSANNNTTSTTDYFPRLIVRYEDLLYHTEEVVEKVCNCAGAKMWKNEDGNKKNLFISLSKPSKVPWKLPPNDLFSAAVRYGSFESRNQVLTPENKEYANVMIDSSLIKQFNYLMPL